MSINSCSIIYNPVSNGFKDKYLKFISNKCFQRGLKTKLCPSQSVGHLISLVNIENKPENLILTMGGDGTVGEAMKGFSIEGQKALYSHISTGTANDTKQNFGFGNSDPIKSMDLILNGNVQNIDVIKVNGEAFGYVSAFGAFTQIPYYTTPLLKKCFSKAGYGIAAFPSITQAIIRGIPKYIITYENDKECRQIPCIMGIISNSKGFGGVNVYKDVKLNDGKFEVILVKSIPKELLMVIVRDFYHNQIDLSKYSDYIEAFSTTNLTIHFDDDIPQYPIDNDGDKAMFVLSDDNRTLNYESVGKVKMLLPK